MPEYSKTGYLASHFKIFHIKDQNCMQFSFHCHDFHKILILKNGDVTYCIEGRSYELSVNDIVLVHAGEVHRPVIKSDTPYERIILYVSPDFLESFPAPDYDLGLCLRAAKAEQSHVLRFHPQGAPKLDAAIYRLDESRTDSDYACDLYRELLFLEFMIQLNRAALNKRINFIENSPSNQKIIAILSYLDEHLTEDISVNELARHFFISRYYLMHMFKEQTGYTIGNYLSTKRLALARELIAKKIPITEVSYRCGFRNYSTFSRAYKKQYGEPPRDYTCSSAI